MIEACLDPSGTPVLRVEALSLTEVTALAGALESRDWRLHRLEVSMLEGKLGLLTTLAERLAFPSWFGMNWDALLDCAADMSWMPAAGHAVLLTGTSAFEARHPDVLPMLEEIVRDSMERNEGRAGARPFKLILCAASPR